MSEKISMRRQSAAGAMAAVIARTAAAQAETT